jgi:hypothetical protein
VSPYIEVQAQKPYPRDGIEVWCLPDGRSVILAGAYDAARLAGREIFGRVPEAQKDLEKRITDAWYTAGCPKHEVPTDDGAKCPTCSQAADGPLEFGMGDAVEPCSDRFHPGCGRLLVGQGDDTYDPECVLPVNHVGLCRKDWDFD